MEQAKQLNRKLPTFSMEDTLPSLPLPSLNETLNKYLESAKVFLDENEYKRTEKIVRDFEYGIGKRLHFYLSEKARNERNWLEKWWLDWAYLEWREPIAPYINTAGQYYTKDFFKNKNANSGVSVQVGIASIQLYYTLCFYDELRRETVEIDASRNGYLSMAQHKRLFNTCRIPLKNKDRLDVHFRTYNEGKCSDYVLVIHKHRFYLLNVYHPTDGTLLNITELYQKLYKLVSDSQSRPCGVGIGALTADHRDTWAENLEHLYKLDKNNEGYMKQIQETIFALVLDDSTPETHDEICRVTLCGNAKNRFFDKSFQVIVTQTGYTPMNMDHTPYDGIIPAMMSQNAKLRMIRDNMNDLAKVTAFEIRQNTEPIKELDFVYDQKIEQAIEHAVGIFNQNSSKSDFTLRNLGFCTKSHIKSYKIHPDTFVQMCMQLGYYQLHRKPPPTYETASTRAYYHGRTETVRTCSQEAVNFARAMCDKKLNKNELLNMFKAACKKHDKLMAEASTNAGCDRHLLGLRLTAQSLNMDVPELYKDVAWKKSGGGGNFMVSSSCIGFTDVYGGCYAMCEEGYGIFYRIGDEGITFFVSNYVKSKETNVVKMQDSLANAVRAVQTLYDSVSKI